jgi:hypothetical protein
LIVSLVYYKLNTNDNRCTVRQPQGQRCRCHPAAARAPPPLPRLDDTTKKFMIFFG